MEPFIQDVNKVINVNKFNPKNVINENIDICITNLLDKMNSYNIDIICKIVGKEIERDIHSHNYIEIYKNKLKSDEEDIEDIENHDDEVESPWFNNIYICKDEYDLYIYVFICFLTDIFVIKNIYIDKETKQFIIYYMKNNFSINTYIIKKIICDNSYDFYLLSLNKLNNFYKSIHKLYYK